MPDGQKEGLWTDAPIHVYSSAISKASTMTVDSDSAGDNEIIFKVQFVAIGDPFGEVLTDIPPSDLGLVISNWRGLVEDSNHNFTVTPGQNYYAAKYSSGRGFSDYYFSLTYKGLPSHSVKTVHCLEGVCNPI